MHIDLAHALASAALILATIWGMRRSGLVGEDESLRWNWKIFAGIFVVIFVMNLVWPVSPA